MDNKPTFYRCGICECFHPIAWNGDCREDDARFAMDELDEKHGPFGWDEVEMPELIDYIDKCMCGDGSLVKGMGCQRAKACLWQ
jgi:hypothetical protein